jgi:hypothetical protein
MYKYAILTFILNIYSFYKITMRKPNGFYKKVDLLFKNYDDKYFYLEEHYVVENGKEQSIVFVSDKKNNVIEDVNYFKKNIDLLFEKRNLILYCGVKERGILEEATDINIEDDITSDFRSFMYYFDKDDFKLDIFFSYLNIDINSDFIIYKNDNNFTEKHFVVKDILDETFKNILLS